MKKKERKRINMEIRTKKKMGYLYVPWERGKYGTKLFKVFKYQNIVQKLIIL